ncbi:hypothetical protein Nizo1840_0715 [Lactiplantibacillus plantarum]|nr:hypothetical protein Nizo1840_0715 [Lactiplantibacillus plantarum]
MAPMRYWRLNKSQFDLVQRVWPMVVILVTTLLNQNVFGYFDIRFDFS